MTKARRETNKAAAQGLRNIGDFSRVMGKVGWFETAHYPNGTPVALVAAVNEFGWPEHNIPPRLGMRTTADASRAAWAQTSKTVAQRVVKNGMTPKEAMEIIGLKAAGDVRKNIASVTQPPLKPATVEARLRGKKQGNVVSVTIAKPLVATGELLNSLTNVVESK